MTRLSVVLITHEEADRIGSTLDSIRFADEVIVVDSSSTDGTRDRCRTWGARVIIRPFDTFAAQKQFALEQASSPWVLALDADERVSDTLAASIRAVVASDPGAVRGYAIARRNFYLGQSIRFAGWYPDRKVRLVARGFARWTGDLHERLEVDGPIGRLEGDLLHHSYRDLADHHRRIERYATLWARQAAARGRKAMAIDLLFRPAWYFFRRYVLAMGFRDGRAGLLLCGMGAFYVFMRYAKLAELQGRDAAPDAVDATGTPAGLEASPPDGETP
jgi:glycosyltransferase involved in cell wall biosynthesis